MVLIHEQLCHRLALPNHVFSLLQVDFAVNIFKMVVEDGAGALPTVVAPKVDFGLTANGLLHFTEVFFGDFKGFRVLRVLSDYFEFTVVVASFDTFHVAVNKHLIRMSDDTLCSCEHRCVMMQELQPMMNVPPEGGWV